MLVKDMGVKQTAHRMVVKCLPTVSLIPNDHNPPPKRASSLMGSSRTYNRLVPMSIPVRKAKIDVDIGGEGLAVVLIGIANECVTNSAQLQNPPLHVYASIRHVPGPVTSNPLVVIQKNTTSLLLCRFV